MEGATVETLTMEEEHLAVTLVARDVRNGRISLDAARAALLGDKRAVFLRKYLEAAYAQVA